MSECFSYHGADRRGWVLYVVFERASEAPTCIQKHPGGAEGLKDFSGCCLWDMPDPHEALLSI